MNPDILAQLSELAGSPPPDWYLNFLLDYPDSLKQARRSIDDTEMQGFVCQAECLSDAPDVLQLNVEVRSESVEGPDGMVFFWPDQMLVIGETGFGDYYCIDVEQEVAGVIQFDHQAVQFEVIADSLDEFVEILEDTFLDGPHGHDSPHGHED